MESINLLNNNMMQFSMYDNLKTGNIIIDMMISTIAVSFITTVGVFIKDNVNMNNLINNRYISTCYRKRKKILLEGFYVVRSWNGTIKTDFPIVIDALFWHISHEKYQKNIDDIKLHTPNLNNFINTYSEDDDTNDNYVENHKNVEKLKKKLIFRPQHCTKFIIDDIEIKLYEEKVESEKSVRENLLYNLKIYLNDVNNNSINIKEWLENIQFNYELYQKKQLDKQKKIFTMIKQEDQIEWYEEEFISGKNWNNLFCTNKDVIKNKLDFFVNNREWYKKRGIPWTFGVLTYGPPGCGKTSLEKVFINYLDRHGVQLNIDENTTYKDIREIFYNPYINGKYVPLEKRVYIIPDIDAMGKVLLKRSESVDHIKSVSFDDSLSNNHYIDDETDENDEIKMENTILKNEKKILEEKIRHLETKDSSHNINDKILTPNGNVITPTSKTSTVDWNFIELMKRKNLGISLSQILNLLDGIVELDGRVLIACTNHINKLDPALIRPGRIDCVVELGLCTHGMIKDIIENFYETEISYSDIEKIPENTFSPCKVYEICFRNTDDLKNALKILQKQ